MKRNYAFLTVVFIACFLLGSCMTQEEFYEGDFEIYNPSDLMVVSNNTSITGDLIISGSPRLAVLWLLNPMIPFK